MGTLVLLVFAFESVNYEVDLASFKSTGYVILPDNRTLRVVQWSGDTPVTFKIVNRSKAVDGTPIAYLEGQHPDRADESEAPTEKPAEPVPGPYAGAKTPDLLQSLAESEKAEKEAAERVKGLKRELGARLLAMGKGRYFPGPDGKQYWGKKDKNGDPTLYEKSAGESAI